MSTFTGSASRDRRNDVIDNREMEEVEREPLSGALAEELQR